jgi:hypothetical protein
VTVQTPTERLDQLERAIVIVHKLVKGLQALLPGPLKLMIGHDLAQLDAIVKEFPR